MEESQSTEYPKSYDPLKGDSQSTEQEAFQLKANEEYRGTFPQGEAGMDTKQVRLGLHIRIGTREYVQVCFTKGFV